MLLLSLTAIQSVFGCCWCVRVVCYDYYQHAVLLEVHVYARVQQHLSGIDLGASCIKYLLVPWMHFYAILFIFPSASATSGQERQHEELRGDREIVLTAVERCGLDALEQPCRGSSIAVQRAPNCARLRPHSSSSC